MSGDLVSHRPITLEAIGTALGGRFRLGAARSLTQELVFYDTFDALLREQGVTVAVADEADIPARARELAGARALLALARVRLESTSVPVLDELDKTVVRLEILRPEGLTARVRLHGLRGYLGELDEVQLALGLPAEPESLRDEAVRAAGGRPEGVSAKVRVDLDPAMAAAAAVRLVLEALWLIITANWDGTVTDIDVEFLHDLRVSVRKTRSVLKEFRAIFEPAELAHWREEFRWLQTVTGETRDLDVLLEDFAELVALVGERDAGALAPLREVLNERRALARRLMVGELRSERARALVRNWPGLLSGLDGTTPPERVQARTPVGALAAEQILRVYGSMVKMGRALTPQTPAEEYHELRKQGKELRYLLELFGVPLYDEGVVKTMVKALKDLQDVLGRHQDREVQAETVRGLGAAVGARSGGSDALIAMGALVRALGEDERAARAEFARAFTAFSSTDQRRLAKRTFTA